MVPLALAATSWAFPLRQGHSPEPKQGACLMDAVSWVVYRKLGDHPDCVCPALIAYGITLDDFFPHEYRQRLREFIPLLPGTNQGKQVQNVRGEVILGGINRIRRDVGLKPLPDPRNGQSRSLRKALLEAVQHGRYTGVTWSIYEPALELFRQAIAIGAAADPVPAQAIDQANRDFALARAA